MVDGVVLVVDASHGPGGILFYFILFYFYFIFILFIFYFY